MPINVVLKDRDWALNHDPKYIAKNMAYWLSHDCKGGGPRFIQRSFTIINDPCGWCGSVCPIPLQGMYNMMMYL